MQTNTPNVKTPKLLIQERKRKVNCASKLIKWTVKWNQSYCKLSVGVCPEVKSTNLRLLIFRRSIMWLMIAKNYLPLKQNSPKTTCFMTWPECLKIIIAQLTVILFLCDWRWTNNFGFGWLEQLSILSLSRSNYCIVTKTMFSIIILRFSHWGRIIQGELSKGEFSHIRRNHFL